MLAFAGYKETTVPALPETRDIAPAQRFDVAALAAYLAGRIDGFSGLEDVRQFKGGASNPTFLIIEKGYDGRLFVMRKKPPGHLLASAHQVDREFRVMRALADTDVPVPRMRALCTDDSVVGTAFYVMDYLEGRIFRDARLPELSPAERAAVYDEANATLAKLHHVDHEKIGLGDFGRPGNYFERQIGRWTKQYRGAETETIPAMEKLIEALPRHIPDDQSISIAHGDYRIENLMFHPTEPKLIAVLDWELSTIGHPLADIAYNGLLWHSMSEAWGNLDGVDFATSGIPTEARYVADYCRRTGRASIPHWNFYLAFSLFRLTSIAQGVYKRILDGIASTDREAFNDTPRRAEQAWALLNG
ncbi:MAG TPA: phosphotransferase [Rhizomicrobium sp.]|nr:phosphotransferase [Rhizomicrobium sp.]